MTAPARLSGALLFALVIIVAQAAPAAAHAVLMDTTPREGAVMPAAPGRLELRFNEPVTPLAMRLVAPDAAQGELPAEKAGETVAVDPGQLAQRGTYLLAWHVVSGDGHPVSGVLSFSVGAPSPVSLPDDAPGPRVRPLLWLARLAVYAGLFATVGGALAGAVVTRTAMSGPARGTAVALGCGGLLGCGALLGLLGLDALALPLGALANPLPWRTAAATSAGPAMALAASAILAALAGLMRRTSLVPAVLALLLAAASLGATGHASSIQPGWIFRPAVALHGAAAILWAGSLLPLLGLVRGKADTRSLSLALDRFSALALPAVIGLVLIGAILAVAQVRALDGLLTPYGLILLAKLAAVSALLALAALNRFRLAPAVARGTPGARPAIARSLAAEIALMAVVAGLVAGWRFTPPPRALAEAEASRRDVSVHLHTEQAMADVSVTPGRAGPNAVSLVLMTGDFGPLDARAVRVTFSRPGDPGPAVAGDAVRQPDGTWAARALSLPLAGRWTLRVDIVPQDGGAVAVDAPVDIWR
jgi:copper transport protein